MTNNEATQTSVILSPTSIDAPYQRSTVPKPPLQQANASTNTSQIVAPKKVATSFIRKKSVSQPASNSRNAVTALSQTMPGVKHSFYPADRIDLETFYKRTMMQSTTG